MEKVPSITTRELVMKIRQEENTISLLEENHSLSPSEQKQLEVLKQDLRANNELLSSDKILQARLTTERNNIEGGIRNREEELQIAQRKLTETKALLERVKTQPDAMVTPAQLETDLALLLKQRDALKLEVGNATQAGKAQIEARLKIIADRVHLKAALLGALGKTVSTL